MKKIIIATVLLCSINLVTFAQKVGYVDTDYILSKMPEYKEAQEELDKMSATWQKEVDSKYEEIEKMRNALEAEQILLTEEMIQKRETQIAEKENEARELQKKRFGVNGDLFKKRQALIKPIQDRVYKSIQEIASKGSYSILFDKASVTMLYTNPKLDKSDAVLKAMGYKI